MRKRIFVSLAFVSVLVSACYTSKKASRPVNVSINENFQVIIEKDPKGHFLDYYTAEQYKETYLKGLKSLLQLNNIIVVTENPEFTVTIEKLVLNESLTTDTIKDPKCPDYGKVYDITKLLVVANGTVASVTDSKKWEAFKADRTDKEKLTNIFPIGAKIGDKKPGPNDWRKKPFDSHEFYDNAYKVGSRTGDVVTNRVNRFIKK